MGVARRIAKLFVETVEMRLVEMGCTNLMIRATKVLEHKHVTITI
jgi:hypothetical protein